MIYKIKDLMNVKRGSSPRPIIDYITDNGLPWLKISDFNCGEKFVYNTKEFIKESGLKNTRYVKKGTLILTNSATPGIPIFLGKDMCLHDGFLYFENIKPEINVNYLYYWFLNYRNTIVNFANGSVFKNLKKEIVENLEIELPSLEIQNKIVYFLDLIDKKIILNEKIINDGHQLLTTIFKNYMNNLDELYSYVKLDDIAEIKNGYAFKGTDFVDKGISVIKIKNVKPNKILLDDIAYVESDKIKGKEKFKINCGDILITMSGNRVDGSPDSWVGKVAIFDREGIFYLNQRVGKIIPYQDKVNNYFLAEQLSSFEMQKYFIERATSSGGQANISPDIIKNVPIKLPSKEIMDKFGIIAEEIYMMIKNCNICRENMKKMKDIYLRKIINNEIEIDKLILN